LRMVVHRMADAPLAFQRQGVRRFPADKHTRLT
jgi:hypothetical protein